jgi:hypothetical protein
MSADERCDYHPEIGLADNEISTEVCERPVWDDNDRCIWHARVDGKTQETLDDVSLDHGENVNGAYLQEAELAGVDWFAGASLMGADLTNADVKGADFSDTNLMLATLTNVSAINTDFSGANLEGAILTNADLRRATLENARLYETILTNVHVGGGTEIGDVSIYDRDSAPPELTDERPLEAASWAYRQLQQLYRKNALPSLARRAYYLERDAMRRLAWQRANYREAIKWELSRWVMRYGGSPYRVLLTSLLVVVSAAVLYPFTGGIQESQGGQTITYALESPEDAPRWWLAQVLFKSLYFSVVTFATLGYGDIQPIGQWARLLAGVEALLGALLSALLVFVLSRIVTW